MHHHDEHCGCGHHHEHGEHCDCGHHHVEIPVPENMTAIQVNFLLALHQRGCLPIARFSYTKSDDEARYAVALEPVFLSAVADTMAQVKEIGNELIALEDMGLIWMEYDRPIQNYAYQEYKEAELYAYFAKTVKEAASKPNPTFDTPNLEIGSMVLSEEGEEMVRKLLNGEGA
jgi:hypothetical protein